MQCSCQHWRHGIGFALPGEDSSIGSANTLCLLLVVFNYTISIQEHDADLSFDTKSNSDSSMLFSSSTGIMLRMAPHMHQAGGCQGHNFAAPSAAQRILGDSLNKRHMLTLLFNGREARMIHIGLMVGSVFGSCIKSNGAIQETRSQ